MLSLIAVSIDNTSIRLSRNPKEAINRLLSPSSWRSLIECIFQNSGMVPEKSWRMLQ
jgi:hypothetical protein